MSKADRMIERLARFVDANDGWSLWIASSMGQNAVDVTERATTIAVESPERFFAAAGLEPGQWELRPAMLPQFNVAVVPEARDRFARFLDTATLGGEPIAYRHKDGFFSVDIGMADLHERPAQARIGERDERYEALGLGFMEIQDRYGATAYHIPEGSLVVYDPRAASASAELISCSALDVAPALLANYAVPRPAYMRGAGLSLPS